MEGTSETHMLRFSKEMLLEVEEADEPHPKTEGVGEEHLTSLVITMASILEPSPSEVVRALTASSTLGSSSSSRHYARLKFAGVA